MSLLPDDAEQKEAMVDIESLSTRKNAHILSIGIVDMHNFDCHYSCNISLGKPYHSQNRHIDEGTVAWWMSQSDEARKSAFDPEHGSISLQDALRNLRHWFNSNNMKKIWSHGSVFDTVILEDAYDQIGVTCPWRFWDVRDTRTVIDIARRATGSSMEPIREGTHHSALDDAIHQAKWINGIIQLFEPEK